MFRYTFREYVKKSSTALQFGKNHLPVFFFGVKNMYEIRFSRVLRVCNVNRFKRRYDVALGLRSNLIINCINTRG